MLPGFDARPLRKEFLRLIQRSIGQLTSLPNIRSINGGPLGGSRNRFINGAMEQDQEFSGASTTFTAGAALKYAIDQWYGYCTGANVTGQRVAGTAPNRFNYQFIGAASVSKIGFAQRMEAKYTQDLAGTTATFSVDLANSLLTTVTWTAWRANTNDTFGTLASPTRTQIGTGTFTVSGTLTRYSAQISVPSAATTGIEIEFSVGAQTSGTWTIGRAQFETGSVATTFEAYRPNELQLCQQYFWKGGYGWNGVGVGAANIGISGIFPVTMRATPTISFVSGGGANALLQTGGANTNLNSVASSGASPSGAWLYTNASSTAGAGYQLVVDNVLASARL
jgi:hypothetical protein